MRSSACLVVVLILELLLLVACQGDEPPSVPPTVTLTPTRTLIPSATFPPPTPTDTPYPTETATTRPPTNTLSATLTQTWPETPTPTATITRTPTRTPTGQPTPTVSSTPTVTGTPPTATPTSTVTNTPTVTPTPTNTSGPGPLLWINPPTSTITGIGATRTIIVTTSNITDVFGIEITMSYSPTILTVIDANTAMVGTQVIPGPCPQASFVVTNAVSLVNGIIEYRVSQTLPTPPCNGGIVLYVVFECVGLGTSPLSVDDVLIAAIDYEIEHTVQDGVITCQP